MEMEMTGIEMAGWALVVASAIFLVWINGGHDLYRRWRQPSRLDMPSDEKKGSNAINSPDPAHFEIGEIKAAEMHHNNTVIGGGTFLRAGTVDKLIVQKHLADMRPRPIKKKRLRW